MTNKFTREDFNKFLPGFAMGAVRAIISHPFEILKLKTQMNQTIMINRTLFTGMHLSILTNSLERGIQFFYFEEMKKKTNNLIVSSIYGSFISTTISLPYNIILLRKNILNKQLFTNKSTFTTAVAFEYSRNLSASVLFLYSYNKLKELEFPFYINACFCSTFVWSLTYPIDNIKNQILAGNNVKYNISFLYKGVKYPIIRSLPSSVVGFYVYENLNNYLNK